MEDWVLYLEQGSQEAGGSSGWGAIRNPHLVYARADKKLYNLL
jgi:hypothetical protein